MPRQTDPLYSQLLSAVTRPRPFETYTAERLWADPHISAKMLEYHLDPNVGLASRKAEFIESSAAWIADRFELSRAVSVADFGCGPGLYATRFAEAGARVTGIDFSPRSIEHARAHASSKGLRIDYVLADYLELETDARYDLITLIFCDLCPLSPAQRSVLLRRFHDLLTERGALLLDVCSLAAFERWTPSDVTERRLMNGFWSPGDYVGLRCSFKYEKEKVTLDKYTIVEPDTAWQVFNWLQYYDTDSLAAELEAAGLQVTETYSDVAGTPYASSADEFAVVAQKAGR